MPRPTPSRSTPTSAGSTAPLAAGTRRPAPAGAPPTPTARSSSGRARTSPSRRRSSCCSSASAAPCCSTRAPSTDRSVRGPSTGSSATGSLRTPLTPDVRARRRAHPRPRRPRRRRRPARRPATHDRRRPRPRRRAPFFGFTDWPAQRVQFDLGGRALVVFGIPGHHAASIAVHDPTTGLLHTGDTVYPGRLYVDDLPAFLDSLDRLVTFAESARRARARLPRRDDPHPRPRLPARLALPARRAVALHDGRAAARQPATPSARLPTAPASTASTTSSSASARGPACSCRSSPPLLERARWHLGLLRRRPRA